MANHEALDPQALVVSDLDAAGVQPNTDESRRFWSVLGRAVRIRIVTLQTVCSVVIEEDTTPPTILIHQIVDTRTQAKSLLAGFFGDHLHRADLKFLELGAQLAAGVLQAESLNRAFSLNTTRP